MTLLHQVAVLEHARFAGAFRPGMEVFVAGADGFPSILIDWLQQHPQLADGVRFTGVFVPGANRFDFTTLSASTRMRSLFAAPDFARGIESGRFELLALSYSEMFRWLKAQRFDLALVSVAPADDLGNHSLGGACDFTPAAMVNAKRVFAHVNPAITATAGPFVARERIEASHTQAIALNDYDAGRADATQQQCAAHIAEHIANRSTVQFGLGKMQGALCQALAQAKRRQLRVHSGMVSDGLLDLVESGCLDSGKSVTTGVALGSAALRRFCSRSDRVQFAHVGLTHAAATLARLPRFVSVNSVIEIDLYGQVNAEYVGDKPVSGCGGLIDFVRGARANPDGLSVLALRATAAEGSVSRIVARLQTTTVSLARHEVDAVATEYGLRRLADLDENARAAALIEIAAPAHQDALRTAWANRRAQAAAR